MAERQGPWFLPWRSDVDGLSVGRDLVAGVVIAAMLVPQGMAYAALAGLPPQVGLYASLLPPAIYALFGTSRYLAVGPVAVVSLMVATATAALSERHGIDPVSTAASVALVSGVLLVAMGLLRLGWITHFLSRPVLSGFLSAAAVLIAISQLPHVLDIQVTDSDPLSVLSATVDQLAGVNPWTVGVAAATILVIRFVNGPLGRRISGLHAGTGLLIGKTGALLAVILAITVTALSNVSEFLPQVGEIPAALPRPQVPPLEAAWLLELTGAAMLISLVGFMESASVGRSLAARDGESIEPDRELVGLGAANLAAGFSAAYPVTGGLSRSIVAADAGARTPLAGVFAALFVLLVLLFATPLLEKLPRAVLAGIVLLAVVQLISPREWHKIWKQDRRDGYVLALTMVAVLAVGVEFGLVAGIAASIALLMWRVSRPHVAVVGRVPGTEHFRNRQRHTVEQIPGVVMLRVDESLQFPNSRQLRETLLEVAAEGEIRDVVLIASAVNDIDSTALEVLESVIATLRGQGIRLHLAEVKGPVMDRLEAVGFPEKLAPGQIFLSTHEAACKLGKEEG